MTEKAIEIGGVLTEEGVIVLDAMPPLPAGPVRVWIERDDVLAETSIWKLFEGIWAGQRARGHVPRTRKEIDDEIRTAREEDEERMLALERIGEESQRATDDRPQPPKEQP